MCRVFERINPVLRLICFGLAALVVAQAARLALRKDPLRELSFDSSALAAVVLENEPPTPKTNTDTNLSASGSASAKKETSAPPRRPTARKAPELPPPIQTRVDRITQSEIFAAVVRPLPMALLGIAGKDAFLRSPNGQTGLLKEGEELGGIKLLRIGTNRVLIEHEQQQKELTLFSGLGGETLLPKTEQGRPPQPDGLEKAKGKANPQ